MMGQLTQGFVLGIYDKVNHTKNLILKTHDVVIHIQRIFVEQVLDCGLNSSMNSFQSRKTDA
jgi:hypothetical protein